MMDLPTLLVCTRNLIVSMQQNLAISNLSFIHRNADTSSFFSITSEGQFSVRSLYLLPHALYQGDPHTPDSQGGNLTSLPLPNPFKAMKSRSVENIPTNEDKRDPGRIGLGDEQILGEILPGKPLHGLRTRRVGEAMYGLAWSASELLVRVVSCYFKFHSSEVLTRCSNTRRDPCVICTRFQS